MVSGCSFKTNSMENIDIYATNYPTEYITERLYGEHATIHSIYPNGVDIDNYTLTDKQIKDYSSSDLYVFTGLNEKEKGYVNELRTENKNLRIIDTTLSMEYTNSIEELWLDPSNFLMMAQNVKKGFNEYIDNYYLNNDIKDNYEELKIEASNLDAKIKQTVTNADKKVIVTSSNMFKYLEKYGLTVYSLDKNATGKTINDVKDLIKNGDIKYIFIKENEEINKNVKDVMKGTQVKTLEIHTITNLSESERTANQNYFDMMTENIETLKSELYN